MRKGRLNIIYEDSELLVINKPSGLLTIGTEKEKDNTLFRKVAEYLHQKNKANKVFIVHRLDKDTSGVILFAKTDRLKHIMQDNWDDVAINREYVALVEGKLEKETGTIKNWLKETSTFITYSSDKPHDGKLAITHYKKIMGNNRFSLLDIKIDTGRKNQIRVHMKEMGNPIVGDKKYGSKKSPINRMGLHASKLEIIHPITHKHMIFEAKVPKEFSAMFEKRV